MSRCVVYSGFLACSVALLVATGGCSRQSERGSSSEQTADDSNTPNQPQSAAADDAQTADQSPRKFDPILLVGGEVEARTGGEPSALPHDATDHLEIVLDALRPFQSLVGEWRGTTHRTIGGFGNVEEVQWQWDFQTDEAQPALVVDAVSSPSYFQSGRLTFLVDPGTYQFVSIDRRGIEHRYRGTWARLPDSSSHDAIDVTYELNLAQAAPEGDGTLARLVFRQLSADRYMLEIFRNDDGSLERYDTITARRQDASFSGSQQDDQRRSCLVSGGRGSIPVVYAGHTYWVCCPGCKAAFEQHPQRWLARHERQRDGR